MKIQFTAVVEIDDPLESDKVEWFSNKGFEGNTNNSFYKYVFNDTCFIYQVKDIKEL